MGAQPRPHPKPYWVLVLPACGAYAWLVPWCLLFIRLFLLNFCFCLAHLARGTCLSCAVLPLRLWVPTRLPSLCHFLLVAGLLSTQAPLAGALDLGWKSSGGLLQPVELPRYIGEPDIGVTSVSWGCQ